MNIKAIRGLVEAHGYRFATADSDAGVMVGIILGSEVVYTLAPIDDESDLACAHSLVSAAQGNKKLEEGPCPKRFGLWT